MNTQDRIRFESQKDPAQLEREIDLQRDHIGELVQALESKLSPGDIFEKVLGFGKGGGGEFAKNLGATVKANPMPTLLTAAGLLWLYADQDKRGTAAAHTTAGAQQKAHLGERVQHVREGASEKLGAAKQRASESAHGAMDSARQQAQRANAGYHRMLDENPMALGAMGIAVGALLGALLPSTRKEDELMGEASDRLTDQAKHLARSGYDKVAEAGHQVAERTSSDGGQHHSQASTPGMGSVTNRPI
jgi:ElaB/YqjD/DUF883 family membrane-anchored ribosome-binding protein